MGKHERTPGMFRFLTQDLAALCDLPINTLHGWVRKGYIRPVKRGYKGQSCSHEFSPQQALAIATSTDFIRFIEQAMALGVQGGQLIIARTLRHWDNVGDDQLTRSALARTGDEAADSWEQEVITQHAMIDAMSPVKVPDDVGERFVKVWHEIQRRVRAEHGQADQAAGRLAAPGGKRGRRKKAKAN
jgi:hypothetical protein